MSPVDLNELLVAAKRGLLPTLERRAYRGSDNPKAQKPVSRVGGPMRLLHRSQVPIEQRPALLPGRKSRREREHVWVPA